MGEKNTTPLKKYVRQAQGSLILHSLLAVVTGPAIFVLLVLYGFNVNIALAAAAGGTILIILLSAYTNARTIALPLYSIEQALDHVGPTSQGVPPQPQKLGIGRDFAVHTVKAIYSLFEHAAAAQEKTKGNSDINYQALLDQFNLPILALDNKGSVVFANNNCLTLLEKKLPEIKGKNLDIVMPLRQKDEGVVTQWLEKCKNEKITGSMGWQDVRFSSSQRRTYSYDVHAVYNRDNPSGADVVLFLVDRTEEREYEDMKVDFVALAAHELRAPITVIRGYMEVFEDEIGESLSKEHREFLVKMKVSGAQLAGFINNILDASRVDRGRLNLHFARKDWPEILKGAIDDLSLQAEALGRKIKLTIEDGLPEVMTDPVSIVEVINNLVDNAIKYSPAGSVINVVCKKGQNGGVQTDIIDHGIGIPPNLLGKLFTKFYRSHRSRQQFSGTGLGLYLSKAIIEAHKGNIWASSKEGEGSTFSIWLPDAATIEKDMGNADSKLEGVTRGSHGWIKNHSLYRR